jgi:hypothetical protein
VTRFTRERQRAYDPTSDDRKVEMKKRRTYTAYSIGCAVVWAVMWILVGTQADDDTRKAFLLAFIGWVAGWASATIARAVYPPPRRTSS